ncbi:MAG: flagellar motor protein MotB [Jatrophihabitantaceae bacterium]
MSTARGPRGRGRGRKQHEEEHVNHERWMVTYADMLTLLLVLFIVLYAISSVNIDKFSQLKASLSTAFGNGTGAGQSPVLSGGSGPVDGSSVVQQQKSVSASSINQSASSTLKVASKADAAAAQQEIDQFSKIERAIKSSLHRSGLDGTAAFSIDERGLVVTLITDDLVFSGNSAVLEPKGQLIMSAVAPALLHIDNQLQVDGHTNQQNVSTAPYPSGWELSSARASAVVRFLISAGQISPSRLSAVGYSDQRPLLPASDPRSITRNRRVDIVVLSKLPASARGALVALGATVPAAADGG